MRPQSHFRSGGLGASTDFGVKKLLYDKKNVFVSYKGNIGIDCDLYILGGNSFSTAFSFPLVIKNSLIIGAEKKNKTYNFIPYFQHSITFNPYYASKLAKYVEADFTPGVEYVYSYTTNNDIVFTIGSYFQYTFLFFYLEYSYEEYDPFESVRIFKDDTIFDSSFVIGFSFSFMKKVKVKKK